VITRFYAVRTAFFFVVLIVCVQVPGALGQQTSASSGMTSTGSDATAPASAQQENGSGATSQKSAPEKSRSSMVVENWSVLPVEHVPPQYLPGETERLDTANTPEFTRDIVQAQWRDHDPIDLYVIRPKGIEKPPVILYLYSYASKTTDHYKSFALDKLLTQYGFAAVGFESALTGDRYHDVPQRKWFVSELQQSLGSTVHDVQLILDYLEKRGDVDMTRVGMFGDGSGATIAILAAAADPRIKVLDLLDPWGDWPDWFAKTGMVSEKERPDYLKPEFLDKVENLDPVKWLPELKTRRVRLQYILNGTGVTPRTAIERVQAAAPPNTKIVHYENKHEFLQNVGLKGTGFDWIKEQLGGTIPKPEPSAASAVNSAPAKN